MSFSLPVEGFFLIIGKEEKQNQTGLRDKEITAQRPSPAVYLHTTGTTHFNSQSASVPIIPRGSRVLQQDGTLDTHKTQLKRVQTVNPGVI